MKKHIIITFIVMNLIIGGLLLERKLDRDLWEIFQHDVKQRTDSTGIYRLMILQEIDGTDTSYIAIFPYLETDGQFILSKNKRFLIYKTKPQ